VLVRWTAGALVCSTDDEFPMLVQHEGTDIGIREFGRDDTADENAEGAQRAIDESYDISTGSRLS